MIWLNCLTVLSWLGQARNSWLRECGTLVDLQVGSVRYCSCQGQIARVEAEWENHLGPAPATIPTVLASSIQWHFTRWNKESMATEICPCHLQDCSEWVLPYLGMIETFRCDHPPFWGFSIWLGPLFIPQQSDCPPLSAKKIGLSLSHLIQEILGPKVGLIFHQNILVDRF